MAKIRYTAEQFEAEARALDYKLSMRLALKQKAAILKEARKAEAEILAASKPKSTYTSGKIRTTTKGMTRVWNEDFTKYTLEVDPDRPRKPRKKSNGHTTKGMHRVYHADRTYHYEPRE
jgi:hypothetical protein